MKHVIHWTDAINDPAISAFDGCWPPFDVRHTLSIDPDVDGVVRVSCYLPCEALEPIADFGRDQPETECQSMAWSHSLEDLVDSLLGCCVTKDQRIISADDKPDLEILAATFERLAQKVRTHMAGEPVMLDLDKLV